MAKLNYRQIPEALKSKKDFEGHSMWALGHKTPVPSKILNENKKFVYIVYSYSTPIAGVTEDGEKVFNETKYSSTTSRQQNLCKAYL